MLEKVEIPSPGESITEVEVSNWLKKNGDNVKKDDVICEIESDKATMEIVSPYDGVIKILIQENSVAKVGDIICEIETNSKKEIKESNDEVIEVVIPSPGESITEVEISNWLKEEGEFVEKDEAICEIESDKATLEINAEKSGVIKDIIKKDEYNVGEVICKIIVSENNKKEGNLSIKATETNTDNNEQTKKISPTASKIIKENNINISEISSKYKNKERIKKQDVLEYLEDGFDLETENNITENTRSVERKKLSALRRKIMERLVSVKNETAMLTTFNEVDMSTIMSIRAKYKKDFSEKKGVNLGFMSFFTKAVTVGLKKFPEINAQVDVDNNEIIYHNYSDISIAVSSPKGLMVPVLRNAEKMSLEQIEKAIKELAIKARDSKLTIDEMSGGTFTITNGGVFGSMMSTPIINPPQSAILGMHNIINRPISVNGNVEVRPMMYIALSYDHRIIDGKESVSFLKHVKEMIEEPNRMIFGGKELDKVLLGL